MNQVSRERITRKHPADHIRSLSAWLIGLLWISLLFQSRRLGWDGEARFESLAALWDRGVISPHPYSMIGPLFASPLYLAGKIFEDPKAGVIAFNWLVLGGGLFLLARELRRWLDSLTVRAFCVLILAASMFPHHIRVFYGEVFTAFAVALGWCWWERGRPALGWTALALGVANTPATLIGLVLASAERSWRIRSRRRELWVAGLGISATVALILLENWVRRGSPLATGYEGDHGIRTVLPYSGLPGFSYPFVLGLLSILLSFGKGLIFFLPGLFFASAALEQVRDSAFRSLWRGWLMFLAGLVLVYSKWWAWYGGDFWGPRFFVFGCIPSSLALAVVLTRRSSIRACVAIGSAVGLSVWIGICGLVFARGSQGACARNGFVEEYLCWYVPEYSALIYPFVFPQSFTLGPRDAVVFALAVGSAIWLVAAAKK